MLKAIGDQPVQILRLLFREGAVKLSLTHKTEVLIFNSSEHLLLPENVNILSEGKKKISLHFIDIMNNYVNKYFWLLYFWETKVLFWRMTRNFVGSHWQIWEGPWFSTYHKTNISVKCWSNWNSYTAGSSQTGIDILENFLAVSTSEKYIPIPRLISSILGHYPTERIYVRMFILALVIMVIPHWNNLNILLQNKIHAE